jgi:hypothetical protein
MRGHRYRRPLLLTLPLARRGAIIPRWRGSGWDVACSDSLGRSTDTKRCCLAPPAHRARSRQALTNQRYQGRRSKLSEMDLNSSQQPHCDECIDGASASVIILQ